MNLADLLEANVAEVAGLPASVHAALANEYAELTARTKRIGAVLDKALEQAYGTPNAPGTSHQERDGYDVKVTAPKRVEWDKDGLYEASDDPLAMDYIEWTPSVPESRYNAAPQRVKDVLDPARTVKIGKAKIEISKKED